MKHQSSVNEKMSVIKMERALCDHKKLVEEVLESRKELIEKIDFLEAENADLKSTKEKLLVEMANVHKELNHSHAENE